MRVQISNIFSNSNIFQGIIYISPNKVKTPHRRTDRLLRSKAAILRTLVPERMSGFASGESKGSKLKCSADVADGTAAPEAAAASVYLATPVLWRQKVSFKNADKPRSSLVIYSYVAFQRELLQMVFGLLLDSSLHSYFTVLNLKE